MATENTAMAWRSTRLTLVAPDSADAAPDGAARPPDETGLDPGPDDVITACVSRALALVRTLTALAGQPSAPAQDPSPLRLLARPLTELATAVAMLAQRGADTPAATAHAAPAVFRRDGDYWTIAWQGAIGRVRDLRGLHLIAQLLREPGREFHALDLLNAHEGGVLRAPLCGGIDILDARAKAEYRHRLRELRDQLEDAEALGDADGAERAHAERDAIAEQLAQAVGLGGRNRLAGAAADRARCTVTHGIRRALARIRPALPMLAEELGLRIRTGVFCVYVPDTAHPTDWVV